MLEFGTDDGSNNSGSSSILGFRTIDGSDNNLDNPTYNSSAGSEMIRIAPANFAAGTFNTPIDGPNAREISNVVSSGPQAVEHDPTGLSAMMYVWGQFIDHDLDRTFADGCIHGLRF